MNSKILRHLLQNHNIDKIQYNSKLSPESIKLDQIYKNIDWKNITDPPPRNSSQETIQELQYLSDITRYIPDTNKKLILLIDDEPLDLFNNLLDKYDIKFPKKEFDEIYKPTYNLVMKIKYYYNRPRPQQLAPKFDLKINVIKTDTHQTPAYPSGHTAYAELAKQLLIHKYGDKIPFNKIDRVVRLTGEARMKQGIHYRSDIEAGQKLINLIFPHLIDYYG